MRPSTALAARLLPVAGALALLTGCGTPPQPMPTAPPKASGSAPPSASGSVALPGATGGLPVGRYPTIPPGTLPSYPPPITLPTTPPPTSATPRPSPAPKCRNGPSKAQVLAAIKGKPGIPADQDLVVYAGPYCAGTWQFTTVEKAGKDPDNLDPLFVVTTGAPAALMLIEAGADVCSDRVQNDAPRGIRVRACGF